MVDGWHLDLDSPCRDILRASVNPESKSAAGLYPICMRLDTGARPLSHAQLFHFGMGAYDQLNPYRLSRFNARAIKNKTGKAPAISNKKYAPDSVHSVRLLFFLFTC
jgi:hypothetical protein